MLKKIIEKIFRRKELADLKEDVQERKAQIKRLTTGETMHLDQHERRMILKAIDAPGYKTLIEEPSTKAYVRIVRKGLREKIKLSIKKEDEEIKEDDDVDWITKHGEKEDDETRGADE